MDKLCPIKWLLVGFVIAIAVCGLMTVSIPSEKRCIKSDDCVFVRTKCCPGCNNFNSVNKEAAQRIEAEMGTLCNDQCPIVECESEIGFTIVPLPTCIDNVCISKDELDCDTFCKYYDDSTDPIFSEYLKKTSQLMISSIEEIAEDCYC